MKKVLLIINIILLFALGGYYIFFIDNNAFIQTDVGSSKVISKIMDNCEETDEDILTDFRFNDETLPYSGDTATFYLPVSMNDSEWEYGSFTSGQSDVQIVFKQSLKDVDKLEAISSNQSYEFIAYTDNKYRIYNVVFTGLPIMEINMTGNQSSDTYEINMKLYDSETKVNWVDESLANISVRGNTSSLYPKQGYKMELFTYDNEGNVKNNNLSLLGMRQDNDWILYAMYNDDTKVRDKLSIDLWNQFGASNNSYNTEFGTDMEYMEVIMNGEYYGIYGLMQPVDAKQLGVKTATGDSTQEYIYKRTTPVVLSLDEFAGDLTEQLEVCGFELKGTSKYGDITNDTWQPLIDYAAFQTNESDEEYIAQAESMVDIENVTDMWLFLQIISGFDNRGKNMYYVSKAVSGGRKMYFVPWDMDLTWGYVSKDVEPLYTVFEGEIVNEMVDWEPGDRIINLNISNSQELVKNKWESLRESVISDESIIEKIEELENIVINSGAMERETNRWPEGGHTTDYTEIKQYALDRLNMLNDYFKGLDEE